MSRRGAGEGMGDGAGGNLEKERGRAGGRCGLVGKPGGRPSPSLMLLKASEHLANCSSPRDANEINSAKCSSGHLRRARCQVSIRPNPSLLLLGSCPFQMSSHPLLCTGPSAGIASPPNPPEHPGGTLGMGLCVQGDPRARDATELMELQRLPPGIFLCVCF